MDHIYIIILMQYGPNYMMEPQSRIRLIDLTGYLWHVECAQYRMISGTYVSRTKRQIQENQCSSGHRIASLRFSRARGTRNDRFSWWNQVRVGKRTILSCKARRRTRGQSMAALYTDSCQGAHAHGSHRFKTSRA
jgi:hypothetical protein